MNAATMRAALLVGAAALFVVGGATAEVRLVRTAPGVSDASVRITVTTVGPWSPVGTVEATLLNPTGDLTGDGFPGWARVASDTLVAWRRPASNEVRIAWGRGERWVAETGIPANDAIGTPRIAQVGPHQVAVAWQAATAGHRRVEVAVLELRGREMVVADHAAVQGMLMLLAGSDSGAHLLIVDDGELLDVLMVDPLPPINPTLRHVFDLGAFLGVAAGTSSETIQAAVVASALRVETRRQGEEIMHVLVWWTAPRELSYVELDEDGPLLPVQTLMAERGPERPERLVQLALREIADRH